MPSNNFTTSGAPPTMLMRSLVFPGELAKPVLGMPIPAFAAACRDLYLSRLNSMALALFKIKGCSSCASNWPNTVVPYSVREGLNLGITTS